MDRKKSWGSNTYIRQNRLQNKGHRKRHRRTLHNTQGQNHQEDINIVNIYATNIKALKYIRKILEDFKKDIDSNIFIVGEPHCQQWIDFSNKISASILRH